MTRARNATPGANNPYTSRGRFIGAMTVALVYAKQYDDSNPEVGMGPSLETLLNNVADRALIRLSDDERTEILAAARGRYRL